VVIRRVGSGSGRTGQVSLIFWKKSGRVGSIYMSCFFRSLIDFDWIEGQFDLGSGQIGFGSDRISLTFLKISKKSDRVGFRSGRVCRVGSNSATSTISCALYMCSAEK
jgi:hypothetical protein